MTVSFLGRNNSKGGEEYRGKEERWEGASAEQRVTRNKANVGEKKRRREGGREDDGALLELGVKITAVYGFSQTEMIPKGDKEPSRRKQRERRVSLTPLSKVEASVLEGTLT